MARLAVARGHLSADQLEEVRRIVADDPAADVNALLVARRWIRRPVLRLLKAELGRSQRPRAHATGASPVRLVEPNPGEPTPPSLAPPLPAPPPEERTLPVRDLPRPALDAVEAANVEEDEPAGKEQPSEEKAVTGAVLGELPDDVFGDPPEGFSVPEDEEQAAALLLRPAEEPSDAGSSAELASPARITLAERLPPRAERFALRQKIDVYLAAAEKEGASDLHLHSGQPLLMRVHGRLLLSASPPLHPDELEAALLATLPEDSVEDFKRRNDADFAYVTTTGLRTRANLYRQNGGVDGIFRLIPRRIPTLAELGLPEEVARFTRFHSGLVLVTGPSGSGKSSTLAALVDVINQERDDHILSIEDPIEFVHESKGCLVNQRQVKRHTESFARALRAALREDPDVIVIGELRDHETISLAITAAETGHLVLGSLHTNGAPRTIGRILDVFPPDQQSQIRSMISESLRGVISQKLLPDVNGGRALALEILAVTPAIGNLIRDDKMHQVRSAMQVGRAQGMRLMADSVRELVQAGRVAPEVAQPHLDQPLRREPENAATSGTQHPRVSTPPGGVPPAAVPAGGGDKTLPPAAPEPRETLSPTRKSRLFRR